MPVVAVPVSGAFRASLLSAPVVEADVPPDDLTASRIAEMSRRLDEPLNPRERLDELQIAANRIVAELFAEPLVLSAQLQTSTAWFEGRLPVRWTAAVAGRAGIPLDRLGTAHRRFCSFAIQRATAASWKEIRFSPFFGADE